MAYINLNDVAKQAFEHIEKKEFVQAESKLSYLLNIYPDDPIFYYYLGTLYACRKQYAFAIMAYEKAIQLNPNFDEALNNLGDVYRHIGDIDSCADCFKKALAIAERPEYRSKCKDLEQASKSLANYVANLGACYVGVGASYKALGHLNRALSIYPELPNGMWNWGLANLEIGNFDKGFEGYDYGMRVGDKTDRSYHGAPNSTPKWLGKSDKKETVVVYGEQGIGDEIMFASMLPEMARDANVIFDCHPRLMDLFRESFPEITVYGTRKASQVNWAAQHQIDAKIAIGSLGKLYRKSVDDFPSTPYLKANQVYKDSMKLKLDALSSKPKIGISWKGGVSSTNKPARIIPLELLKPLFDLDCEFISLQYHCNAQAEIDVFHESQGRNIITHWQSVIDDYDLTAGLLTQLDCVISVPQSIIHLAGSLGVKTYQLCPKRALWQMGVPGTDAPWYKCVKNIWQEVDDNWVHVIELLVMQLKTPGTVK